MMYKYEIVLWRTAQSAKALKVGSRRCCSSTNCFCIVYKIQNTKYKRKHNRHKEENIEVAYLGKGAQNFKKSVFLEEENSLKFFFQKFETLKLLFCCSLMLAFFFQGFGPLGLLSKLSTCPNSCRPNVKSVTGVRE